MQECIGRFDERQRLRFQVTRRSVTTDDGCVLPLLLPSSEPTPTDAEALLPVPSPVTPLDTTWAALTTTPFSPLLCGPLVGMVPLVVLPVLPVLQLLPLLLMLIPLVGRPLPQPPLSVLSWAEDRLLVAVGSSERKKLDTTRFHTYRAS
uniref:Uncharacterized protein n=1 Tax=Anopheles maculatus TaxID=74869 RepID=A0A182S6C1_9DIPT